MYYVERPMYFMGKRKYFVGLSMPYAENAMSDAGNPKRYVEKRTHYAGRPT